MNDFVDLCPGCGTCRDVCPFLAEYGTPDRILRERPEVNPAEHIWDDLREKEFHNRVFDSIDSLEDHLEKALHDSIVAWPWIINALLN